PTGESRLRHGAPGSPQSARKNFATGVYALWYPLLAREEVQQLVKKRRCHGEIPAGGIVHATGSGGGMTGSGML
ncbi:MAG: 23S rRNA (adenine(2030)-N(6))-methyltransferase RlmJ, partial [Haliea sp.]|nr:23S rRNA (adenine(2030)-N(6))-methyltransferase RlmJ [Haliea sp.]